MGPVAAPLVLAVLCQVPNQARIHGRFLDAMERPVADARVLSRVWPGDEFPVQSTVDGAFETVVTWPAEHRDTWFECTTRVLGSALWTYRGQLAPGQELDLGTVRLEPGGAVSGRIVLGAAAASGSWVHVVQ